MSASPARSSQRSEAVSSYVNRPARQVHYPSKAELVTANSSPSSSDPSKPAKLSALFAYNVYGLKQLQETLPTPVFARLQSQIAGAAVIDRPTADAVAHAVKVWAMERGATHFTHWFQPLTNSTAEKHDCFLSFSYKSSESGIETVPLDSFSGSQLIQAEPDASSFPNGGARSTFEARGYTVWDTTSPMFLQEGPHGTKVLYIPSVFISYHGDALDEKTVLLRSSHSVSQAAVELLRLLGDNKTRRVHVTLGTEQEFFLVDRQMYAQRPDLKLTGRTLVGVVPAKHQQLEDHYFGSIPSRALAAISEAELELWKLGVPIKTRHNEVAPQQFEVAPIFEEASVAVDHNLLTMQVIHRVAHRHGLKALFHEKPFAGVNGSGKHCNWSLSTDDGRNLLDPGDAPEDNDAFLLVLVGILVGLHRHSGLLRAAIASSSNEHRLGANEAPPSIISAFLGEQLNAVLEMIEKGASALPNASSRPSLSKVHLGNTVIDIRVATLPEISRDQTDRNRTSPFAFTGNRFEFRAVGSKQSPSFPVSMLNSITAAGLLEVVSELRSRSSKSASSSSPSGSSVSKEDIRAVLRHFIVTTKAVRFEGDGYSEAWVREAEKRGLPNIPSAPAAFKQLLAPTNQAVLVDKLHVLSQRELQSRYHVLCETFSKGLLIEAGVLRSIAMQHILPAAIRYRKELATAANAVALLKLPSPEVKQVERLGSLIDDLERAVDHLDSSVASVKTVSHEDAAKQADVSVHLTDALQQVRRVVDKIEESIADDLYPFPKYGELLFC